MADQFLRMGSIADPVRRTIRARYSLETVPIGIRLWMNPRSFRWAVDILDSAGRPVFQGHALGSGTDCLEPYRPLRPEALPPGQLWVQDTTGAGESPKAIGAWRERWLLRYRPAADVSTSTLPRVV